MHVSGLHIELDQLKHATNTITYASGKIRAILLFFLTWMTFLSHDQSYGTFLLGAITENYAQKKSHLRSAAVLLTNLIYSR